MPEQRPINWLEVVAAGAAMVTLLIALFGGLWNLVDEDELKATEDRITNTIRESTSRTDGQMEELRGYIVSHLDRHATGAAQNPAN